MEDEKREKQSQRFLYVKDGILLLFVSGILTFLLIQLAFYEKLILFLIRFHQSQYFLPELVVILGLSIFTAGLLLILLRLHFHKHQALENVKLHATEATQMLDAYKKGVEEQNQLFRAIGEQASDGIMVVNLTGKIVYWNKQAASIFGYERDERSRLSILDFIPKNNQQILFDRFTSYLSNRALVSQLATEIVIRRKDHSEKTVEVNPSVITYKGTSHALIVLRDIEIRKQLESQSKELSRVVSFSSLPIIITEPTGIIRYVNSAWEQLTGWTSSEVVGISTPRIIKGDKHSADFYKNLWETISRGERFQNEMVNRRKDGSEFIVDEVINPIKDDNGNITGYVGFLRDISQRKRMTHNLQERVKELNALYRLASMTQDMEKDYRVLLEQVPQIVKGAMQYSELAEVSITVRGKVYQTEGFKMTPWKMQEKLLSHHIDFGEITIVYTKEQPLIDVGPFFLEEKRLIAGVASLLGHYIDHVEDEHQMKETSLRLRSVIRSLSDTVLISNAKGALETILFEKTENDSVIEKHTIFELYEKEAGDALLELGKEALRKNTLLVRELEMTSNLGKQWFEVRATPLKKASSSQQYFVLILRNIHDHKLSEMRRLELERLKSQFLTTLTHSTRTPLTELRWGIEGILAGDYSEVSVAQQSHLRQLLQSELRVLRLITNIELAIDIERGGITLQKLPGSLVSLMALVKKEFDRECTVRQIECDLIISAENFPSMHFDRELMRVAFSALFDNAVRFSKTRSMISIRFDYDEKYVRVSVKDSGIGIPEEEQAYIFDRFYRATNAASAYPDGVGLGLNISQQIAKLHGGLIRFESRMNEGSEFIIELPRNGNVDKKD